MTISDWRPVALAKDVLRRPRQIWFENMPVVLFHDGRDFQALFDRCPHRFAELSKGRVMQGAIECPYHGWRFQGGGKCVAMPGHLDDLPNIRVKSFAVLEQDQVIFIAAKAPDQPPYIHAMVGQDIVVKRVESRAQSTLLDVAENILDATHTHFTHKGILRGLSAKRYRVKVEVSGGPGMVEAVYTGEDKQQGLVSTLLEGGRTKTVGRFRAPGIAELEYWGPKGINLVTSFHLRQSTPQTVDGIGWLVGPRDGGLGHLKALFFKPLFRVALGQDQRILARSAANAARDPVAAPVVGPLDFLRADIERILNGDLPQASKSPRTHYIEL
ncbi:Rieske 2Fe-2S domain-containing protein [Pseudaestuariivita rosea]|uniref:Rieske 2Fe-2S domain-containing protein n=1 Tax=Pseudaestuariivita rosea TaxID=2763263 RepID=UPI001ABB4C23|nr:Rieske 2Fe-2S domain-containing protein [Pseudaestuariivita rosea]